MQPAWLKTATLTALALTGFATNSLLCRAALGADEIDPASFTALRLISGAGVLAILLRSSRGPTRRGSWGSALALFAYAAAFSLAYVRIPTGVGALVLFGCVQLTMLGTGIVRGERPRLLEWAGLAVAMAGLIGLAAPGTSAPDLRGVALMSAAGVAWGVYSLRGRGSTHPIAVTADNFLRTVPFALVFFAVGALLESGPRSSPLGATLAITSGAVASAGAYCVWYSVLPRLTATRAGIVQLSVPVLAALGGVALLDEQVTTRLIGSGVALLGGVLLALTARAPKPAAR